MRYIILISLICLTLQAHALKIFVKEEANELFIKSYFYGNTACKECEVSLFEDEKVFQSFKLDELGQARITLTKPNFTIVVDGGLGHRQSLEFKAENFTPTQQSLGEEQNTFFSDLPKFILSFALLALFFAGIYFLKARKT
ncbi:hypothetical protein CQA38_02490 [Campylobacter sp. MIT 12-5580]|uniref:hypothetical protein n=1 Tax=Campylobacter sp. MIT 12-5580 TaxID=2040651 RepID=UPI0010F54E22|nr:hypothetical protein [Campylobacter sp. MIT 12-5580]TKX29657.1 hypothetical protein CQA38_02490 [Campylobacter sp. MIT 12-5580]